MIFRTITDDITGANKSIGLFGKSLNDIKGIINSFKQNGFVNTLLNTPLINIDIDAIDNYNNAIRAGKTYEDALATARRTTNAETVALIESSHGAEVQIERVTAAQKASTIAAKAHSVALKAASIAGNMILFTAIAKGIQLATTAIDNWIHRVEKANEAMNEAVGEYESAKSSLESVNTELEDQNKKMDELLSKDKLTYAEQGQLEELQAITKELLLQQDIAERNADRTSKEAADKAVDAYKKQYGRYDTTQEKVENLLNSELFPVSQGNDDISANIATYVRATELLAKAQNEYEQALKSGEDTTWFVDDLQFYIDMVDDYSDALDTSISDLQEKRSALEEEYNKVVEKRESNSEPLTSSEQDIISTYESIYNTIKMVYEYYNQNAWNNMEMTHIFNTKDIEKTKDELIAMAKVGELKPETIASYENLNDAIQNSELILKDGQTAAQAFCDEIYASIEAASKLEESLNEPEAFDISTYKDTLSDIQSSLTTLRSALESFNKGELDKIQVLDLMQQFPSLVPYIDLTADGFGNLSEGLSELISQQPDSLIQSLQALKESLSTDEEREQVELLIDQLQRLSSYGDSGIEAYATTIGSTWDDTSNVIEGVTTQFENLAKVQEYVAKGLTMSATAAAELANMYPEILTNAQVSANGQITLNEEVVKNILDGDKSIVDAQITKLEADKAVLISKQNFAHAQLDIVKQTAEGEGKVYCPLPQ